jgi:hypothetical protein
MKTNVLRSTKTKQPPHRKLPLVFGRERELEVLSEVMEASGPLVIHVSTASLGSVSRRSSPNLQRYGAAVKEPYFCSTAGRSSRPKPVFNTS